ncbi:MAG: hypothetical protein R3Y61_07770 [Rikenellaceae bacterium]
MKKFSIIPVNNARGVKNFHRVASRLYKDDPNWVCPLFNDIEHIFSPQHNPLFSEGGGGEAIRWVLVDERGELVGRIAAFYNREKASIECQPTGGCGFFECIDDFEAASCLFDAAKDWLKERGMEAMDGSVNFGDRLMWWGVLVEGFYSPLYGMNYNLPYYGALFEAYGFGNYFNQHTYMRPFDPEIRFPEALIAKAQRLYENPDYTFTTFDKRNTPKMARDFCEVYNKAWAKFEGVKPLSIEAAEKLIASMKPIIDPEVLFFAYKGEQPIGFFVITPDINPIIKDFNGKLNLINKLKLLYRLKTKKAERLSGLIFGVVPEYQSHGIEAALIRMFEMYVEKRRESGTAIYDHLQMQWVGDFNPVMMRMCESYVRAVRYKRHITYRYLFDREKEFCRAPRLSPTPRAKKVEAK